MCITKKLFDDVLGNVHEALEREREARQRIASLLSRGMSVDELELQGPPMTISSTKKLLRCRLKQSEQEQQKRFATLRVSLKSDSVYKTLLQEQELMAANSSPTIIAVWEQDNLMYQLFKDEIVVPIPSLIQDRNQILFAIQSLSLALVCILSSVLAFWLTSGLDRPS